MKLAYISSPYFADCDTPLLEGLSQQGVDLTYIIRLSDSSKKKTLLNISTIGDRKSGIYAASEFNGLESIGQYVDLSRVFVLYLQKDGGISFSNILSVFSLLMFLIRGKFDIIHLTWPLGYYFFPLYTLRRRMVMTVHDPLPHSSYENDRVKQFNRRVAFRVLRNFVLLNKSQKEDFINFYHLHNKKIFDSRLSVYNHLSKLIPVKPDLSNYILFFGQISSYKGLDVLCNSMRIVKREFPDSKLIVAGRGDLYFDIDDFVKDGTIDFRNYYIPDAELAGLIKYSEFAVCPYRDATQSGVIMSAFALNTPVIVTDVGALPEMVDYGRYSPIVPVDDVAALASTIIKLLKSPQLLQEYRTRIENDYSEGIYSWKNIAHDMNNIYQLCSNYNT